MYIGTVLFVIMLKTMYNNIHCIVLFLHFHSVSRLTLGQAMKMHADGNVLPSSFSIIAKNGKATNFFLTPGAQAR